MDKEKGLAMAKEVFSGFNTTLLVNLLLSSLITIATTYSANVCHESDKPGNRIKNDNLPTFLVSVVVLSLILMADSGMTVFNSMKSQDFSVFVPAFFTVLGSIINILSSYVTYDCYSRSVKETLGYKYKFTNGLFFTSAVSASLFLLMLRHLISPLVLFFLAGGSMLSTYLATQCYNTESGKVIQRDFPLNLSYLKYNMYFSGTLAGLIFLNLTYQMYFT